MEIAFKLEDKKIPIPNVKDTIKSTHTEEIIIGLCGPIGTDITFVSDSIKKVLEKEYQYSVKIIKLSSLVKLSREEDLHLDYIKTKLSAQYGYDLSYLFQWQQFIKKRIIKDE